MKRVQKPILFGPLPPPYGGVAIFMNTLAAQSTAHNFRIWSYKGTPSANGIFVNHRRFAHIAALFREGRGGRIIDSTHFHLEYPNKILLPLWIAAKKVLRFQWIKILHDGSLSSRFENFSAAERKLFRLALKNIDEIVVTGEELEIWLRDEIKFVRKISFIQPLLPLPPDWENAAPNAELAETLARVANYKKKVCSVGVFISSYGFQHAARAVENLRRESGENIGLLLVDGGFAGDENFRAEVLKDRDWIETAEKVPHPLLANIFRQSDVFIRGFAHESYGLSRIESLWCGTPVIATNAGETRGMSVFEFGDTEALILILKKTLAGENQGEIAKWAEIFRVEAKENLTKYLRIIEGVKL